MHCKRFTELFQLNKKALHEAIKEKDPRLGDLTTRGDYMVCADLGKKLGIGRDFEEAAKNAGLDFANMEIYYSVRKGLENIDPFDEITSS